MESLRDHILCAYIRFLVLNNALETGCEMG